MNQLLIYLHSAQYIDYRVDANGHVQHENNITVEQLPAEFRNNYCIVLVPGEHVTIHPLMVPNTSHAKLAKIVPYAIEEQLSDNPEELHFAFDQVGTNGLLPTAVIKKSLLQDWLIELRSANIQPKVIIPDYLALPYEEGIWHIYLTHNRALIRIRPNYGASVELIHLAIFLQLALEDELVKPHAIKIAYSNEHPEFDRKSVEHLNIPVLFAEKTFDTMDIFRQGLSQSTTINLLQGDFVPSKPSGKTALLWRMAKILFIICGVVWAVANLTTYILSTRQLKQINQQIETLYFQVFPQANSVVEPDVRIQQLYSTLKASGSGGNFLSLLAIAGQQIQAQGNNIVIQELRFSDNALILEVQANDFKNFDTFSQLLLTKQISVQQSNAHTTDQGVTARLTLVRGRS